MTRIYVDATTLIALGTIGELDLLTVFDGRLIVLPTIRDEVVTEPASTNLDRFLDRSPIHTEPPGTDAFEGQAQEILDESTVNGDVGLIAAVLTHVDAGEEVAIVSDDRRIRTVAQGIGARVTGTIGVVVRAVEEELSVEEGTDLVRRLDQHGLHMTAELREKAYELIEEAADREPK